MLFIVAFALAAGFCALCRRPLQKKPLPFYLGFTILACLAMFLPLDGWSLWARTNIAGLFTKGYLASALFVVVMLTGALKNGSALMKALMPIRGQLSICAGILLLGHFAACIKTLLSPAGTGAATPWQIANIVLAALLLLIFAPLWVTSFPRVRAKMKPAQWKRLQRYAYGFYALSYVHMMVVVLPHALAGNSGSELYALLYTFVYVGYAVLRISKARKRNGLLLSCVTATCAFVLLFALLTLRAPKASAEGSSSGTVYADGVYEGEAMGYESVIKVQVTIENDLITDIEILSSQDTAGYFDEAEQGVIPAILEAQSTWVDAVTGATTSSWGIMDAVQAALDTATSE